MGLFRAGDTGREQESKRGGVWPAGAGGKVATAGAMVKAYWQSRLPRLLKHHACKWLMGEDVAPEEGGSREIVRMGAEGGVCIIGSGSAHRCNSMRCPKGERVK